MSRAPESAATRTRPAGRAPSRGQFGLLGTRRLGPLFVTQFLGAFNDNVFKAALAVLFAYGTIAAVDDAESKAILVNLAAGLFILPFFLFSATAGALADKFEKARLIRFVKLGEIGVAALAGIALYLQSVPALLAALFLLGVQSTFFGPLKYAVLPQHLDAAELVGGNAMVQMGTFVAILLGTIAGTTIAGFGDVSLGLFVFVVAIAAAGYATSRAIPDAPSFHAAPVRWNPATETWALIRLARERKAVFQSILGISWFWLLGSVYLAQIPVLVPERLAGGPSVVTLVLVSFTVAIGIGSLLCERLSRRRVEIGLVPLGAVGVSIFGIDLHFALGAVERAVADAAALRGAWAFLGAEGTTRVLIDLVLMGVFAGLFVVPLQANIQARTPEDRRARVIAANNVLNALFMVGGAGAAIAWLALGGSLPTLLLALAFANIAVSVYIFRQVPEFTMRFLVWLVSHAVYRVRHHGLDNVPERGAALIVCNHVSYADAPVLAGAVRRPIRFVMYKPIYDIPVLNFIFRTGRAIPITGEREDPAVLEAAFAAIREGLAAGDLLCIFPEGQLTSDGELGPFRKGVERILAQSPVPVVPMALRGLWGSIYSREGAGAFRKLPQQVGRRIDVVAGALVEPAEANAEALRERVLALRGDAA